MRKLALLLLALFAVAGAQAQPVTNPAPSGAAGAYNTSAPTCTNGNFCFLQTDVAGQLKTTTGPSGGSTAGITPIVSAAAEGSHVLKASGGNLYSVSVTSGAAAGYLLVHNAAAAPSDGAVTPILCVQVPANATVSADNGNIPSVFNTGITAVFSTTGCFTQTTSATAFFHGRVQ